MSKDKAEAPIKVTAAEEEKVTIKLPREKGSEDSVFVSVNERTWQIKRGVPVEVPACVAEVLRNQEKALDEAYNFQRQVEK